LLAHVGRDGIKGRQGLTSRRGVDCAGVDGEVALGNGPGERRECDKDGGLTHRELEKLWMVQRAGRGCLMNKQLANIELDIQDGVSFQTGECGSWAWVGVFVREEVGNVGFGMGEKRLFEEGTKHDLLVALVFQPAAATRPVGTPAINDYGEIRRDLTMDENSWLAIGYLQARPAGQRRAARIKLCDVESWPGQSHLL